jgi:TIR domain
MASIYISHSRKDRELATQVALELRDAGQNVFIDIAGLTPGADWRTALTKALSEADVILVLITVNSESSKWVMSEIGAARAYQQTRGDIMLIPVVVGEVELPPLISDIQAIFSREGNAKNIAMQVVAAVNQFVGIKAAKQAERKEIQERIEKPAADYIEEALDSLGSREKRYRKFGFGWYAAGFIALIAGIATSVVLSRDAMARIGVPGNQWPLFAYLALKSLIIIGLLVATSKYSFSLGRSYMTESLKNSDRLHAISFGKFYLRVYGEKATWAEIKEAFQHWNIATDSAFSQLDPKEFDPNFLGAALDFAKAISNNVEKKK